MNLSRLFGALSLLSVAGALVAGSPDRAICECKPREVGDGGSRKDWEGYSRDKGIRWHYSVDEAMRLARAEGKLVLWYHVVGDLDKEGC